MFLNNMITDRVPTVAGAFDTPKIMVREIPIGNKPPIRGFGAPENNDSYKESTCVQCGSKAGLSVATMFRAVFSSTRRD
jgi:hypothetical protein